MAEEKKYLTAEEFIEKLTDKGHDVEVPGLGTIKVRSVNRFDMLRATKYEGYDKLAFLVKNSIMEPELPDEVVTALMNSESAGIFDYAMDVAGQVAKINKATPEPGEEGAE